MEKAVVKVDFRIGEVKEVRFGELEDNTFGLSLILDGKGWCGTSDNLYAIPLNNGKAEDNAKVSIFNQILDLLKTAKVKDIQELVSKKVEVRYLGNKITDIEFIEE